MALNPDELKFELWPPKPTGGMCTGTIPNGVKLTHQPTGNAVICQSENHMLANKHRAVAALEVLING